MLTTKQTLVDCEKASLDLDHISTISLEDGIRNTINWMKEHYKVS